MRVQTNGMGLPLPREVNVKLFMTREKYRVDENNVLLVPFAQLTAHDVTGVSEDIPPPQNGRLTTHTTVYRPTSAPRGPVPVRSRRVQRVEGSNDSMFFFFLNFRSDPGSKYSCRFGPLTAKNHNRIGSVRAVTVFLDVLNDTIKIV